MSDHQLSVGEKLSRLLSREYAFHAGCRYYQRNFRGRALTDFGGVLLADLDASENRSMLLNKYCNMFNLPAPKTACTECIGSMGETLPDASKPGEALVKLAAIQTVIVDEATQLSQELSEYPFVVHGLAGIINEVMAERLQLQMISG